MTTVPTISLLFFVCLLVAATLASFVGARLPAHHASKETRDVVRLTTAMLATLTALVVGLLIGSVHAAYESKDSDLKRVAAQIVSLDRTLAQYGAQTQESRRLLRRVVETRIADLWLSAGEGRVDTAALSRGLGFEEFQQQLLELVPGNEGQKWLQARALQLTADIMEARWLMVQKLAGSIQWPLLVVLLFWLTAIFFSFGLFAPRNATVLSAFGIGALSVAGSVYLMLAMDQPYGGPFALAGDAWRLALEELQRGGPP